MVDFSWWPGSNSPVWHFKCIAGHITYKVSHLPGCGGLHEFACVTETCQKIKLGNFGRGDNVTLFELPSRDKSTWISSLATPRRGNCRWGHGRRPFRRLCHSNRSGKHAIDTGVIWNYDSIQFTIHPLCWIEDIHPIANSMWPEPMEQRTFSFWISSSKDVSRKLSTPPETVPRVIWHFTRFHMHRISTAPSGGDCWIQQMFVALVNLRSKTVANNGIASVIRSEGHPWMSCQQSYHMLLCGTLIMYIHALWTHDKLLYLWFNNIQCRTWKSVMIENPKTKRLLRQHT